MESRHYLASTWAIFYAGVVSIKEHPRNLGGADLDACAHVADAMLERFVKRWRLVLVPGVEPEGDELWRG